MIPALACLCIVSIGIKDGVYNLKVSGNESVFFSFVWRLTYKNAQNCYGMLIKIQKSLWNLIYAQMIVFLSLINATSRNSSAIYANECIFSHNEQQKV